MMMGEDRSTNRGPVPSLNSLFARLGGPSLSRAGLRVLERDRWAGRGLTQGSDVLALNLGVYLQS